MKPINLQIHPFAMAELLDCRIFKRVNEHMEAFASGYLAEKDCGILKNPEKIREISIEAADESGERKSIFRGVLCGLAIEKEGGLTKIEIRAKSRTVLLDRAEENYLYHSRKQTYKSIVRDLASRTDQVRVIYGEASSGACGIVAQYGETDWEFLKRLASRTGEVVVADCTNDRICIYFGMPEKRQEELDVTACKLYSEGGMAEYVAESRDVLELCTPVIFAERKLYVYEAETRLLGSEPVTKYRLRGRRGFQTKAYSNEKLRGASLLAEVAEVSREKLRIRSEYSRPEGEEDTAWFSFATVYSSPGGTGWYCMPEEGDQVRLHFPDHTEEHAYVLNAVHLEALGEQRKKPEEKSFRTKYDKEIRLTPDRILITNHKGMEIELDDEKGISIKSSRDIRVVSEDGIELESGKRTQIHARQGILFRENHNSLAIADGIRHTGLTIEYR
jgi:hypothetical protein